MRARTPSLRECQRWLAAQILARHGASHDDEEATRWLALPAGASAYARLHAYADGYPARLREALAEVFPAIAHLVGGEAFTGLTRRYLRTAPPRAYNLNDAGSELPRFLDTDALAAQLPFLPDLARLEWQLARAFHARHLPPCDPTALAGWSLDDWARAVLRFQPSVTLVESAWPIRELWEARETLIAEIDIDVRDRPDAVLVWRAGLDVRCESLPAGEALCLRALLAGQTLGAATAQLAAGGHDPAGVSAGFARWMAAGMIQAVVLTAVAEPRLARA